MSLKNGCANDALKVVKRAFELYTLYVDGQIRRYLEGLARLPFKLEQGSSESLAFEV